MEIKFDFYDLPLLTVGPVQAGFINGTANIEFFPDGEWFVHEIELHGEQNGPAIEIEYDGGEATFQDKLYLHIEDQLENGKWAGAINDKVAQELLERRIEAGDLRSSRELMIAEMA